MNIVIQTYVNFSGPANELTPLVEAIAKAVVDNGYAVDESQDNLTALIVVKESDVIAFENPNDFAKNAVQNSLAVVIPLKEEEDAEPNNP